MSTISISKCLSLFHDLWFNTLYLEGALIGVEIRKNGSRSSLELQSHATFLILLVGFHK